MSLVACTPVGFGQPASSAASTPTLSGPCAYTPTSSMSGRPMMACSDRRPMLPVVHWITRSERSGLVVLMGALYPLRRSCREGCDPGAEHDHDGNRGCNQSVADIESGDLRGADPHCQFTGNRVAAAELVGAVGAHVPRAGAGRDF